METDYDSLVSQLAYSEERNAAIVSLVGAINANDLRKVILDPRAKEALIAGLDNSNAKVRWWCLQLMDHLADESFAPDIMRMLKDSVGKVRLHALHALTCDGCKQDKCALDIDLTKVLNELAENDPDARVREEAAKHLEEASLHNQ